MDLHAILIRAPINRLAANVVSQRRVAGTEAPLTREELAYLVQRLERKHRLLKHVLGIKSQSQHKNTLWKKNKRLPQFRQSREPRAFQEYVRLGREMQRLIQELAALRAQRRAKN